MGEPIYDVAVIGGGASGLTAALAAARAGARVLVLERDVACGLPILATGNGRCNLSNARLDPVRYRDAAAARAVMGEAPEAGVSAFLDGLGIMTCEVEGRLYPVTRRADSVRDALLAACGRARVEMRCGAEVLAAEPSDGGWALRVSRPARPVRVGADAAGKPDLRRARRALAATERVERDLRARAVVFAVGGASGHMCRLLGLPHVDEEPVLCPLACEAEAPVADLAALDGLRVEASLALTRRGREVRREAGEVLFRPYGISGIAAFDLSRRAVAGDVVELDLFPDLGANGLLFALRRREGVVGAFGGDPAWFDGVLARPLARFALDLAACRPEAADGLRGDLLAQVAKVCRALPLRVLGRAEGGQAQVRRGGVPLDAVDLSTLAVPAARGLFACGEALDQDADCGGFNLAWAWLSGLRAGEAAARCALAARGEAGRP